MIVGMCCDSHATSARNGGGADVEASLRRGIQQLSQASMDIMTDKHTYTHSYLHAVSPFLMKRFEQNNSLLFINSN